MAKKLFTFLGAGNYENIIYYLSLNDLHNQDYIKIKSGYVQVSLSKLLGDDTEVIVFLTSKAKKQNWINADGGACLKSELEDMHIKYDAKDIKDGTSEDELWDNFNTFYEACSENDDIYLDITYSFRSIPVIFMSVLNYAAATKNIKLKGIYYGAYEARTTKIVDGNEIEAAPIFNLNFFYKIQDWTRAAEQFLETGDSRGLGKQIEEAEQSILGDENLEENNANQAQIIGSVKESIIKYSEDIVTCRGRDLIADTQELKLKLESMVDESNITLKQFMPLVKIINNIYIKIEQYDGQDIVGDFIYAVQQCDSFNLIQQGYTILQESLITYLMCEMNLDYANRNKRSDIEKKINLINKMNEQSTGNSKVELYFSNRGIDLNTVREISSLHKYIGDFRNDLNHGGFAKENNKYIDFKENLNKAVLEFENIISNNNALATNHIGKKALVILSHDLMDSQINDLKNNWNVSEIVYITDELKDYWKNINPQEELSFEMIKQFAKFIEDNTCEDDYVLVQGEYGMTFAVVNKCFKLIRVPIYATTERVTIEKIEEGEVHSETVFRHVRFRKYPEIDN